MIHEAASVIEVSAGQPTHARFVRQAMRFSQRVKPLLLRDSGNPGNGTCSIVQPTRGGADKLEFLWAVPPPASLGTALVIHRCYFSGGREQIYDHFSKNANQIFLPERKIC